MRVEVYYNLHKHLWSVRKSGGKILYHTDRVALKDCKFVVRPSGRERVRLTKQKNVHAFVRGELLEELPKECFCKVPTEVTYNPYKYDTFVLKMDDFESVMYADVVELDEERKVYAWWKG